MFAEPEASDFDFVFLILVVEATGFGFGFQIAPLKAFGPGFGFTVLLMKATGFDFGLQQSFSRSSGHHPTFGDLIGNVTRVRSWGAEFCGLLSTWLRSYRGQLVRPTRLITDHVS